jgi:hypothetical protein
MIKFINYLVCNVHSYLDLGLVISAWDDVENRTEYILSPDHPKKVFFTKLFHMKIKCRRCKAKTYIFLGGQLTAETSDGAFNLVHCIVRLLQVLETQNPK